MNTMKLLTGLALLFAAIFSAAAQTVSTTPTNGPTTVTVHARTTDGKAPVGVVESAYQPIIGWGVNGDENSTVFQQRLSSFDSKSGEWTFTNVPPGPYKVVLFSTNYVYNGYNTVAWFVIAGTNYRVELVMSNGATYKGRVLDDVTGKPIANEHFLGGNYMWQDVHTDAEGRYEWRHVTGDARLDVRTTNYLEQEIKLDAADEDSTVLVPDIRLQPGGRISGRVERPAGLTSNTYAWVQPVMLGALVTNPQIKRAFGYTNGTFRTDPLPAGTYSLTAEWESLPSETIFVSGYVSGITVVVGQETTNVVIPTKMVVQTNGASGR
jgi:hypothetical protein